MLYQLSYSRNFVCHDCTPDLPHYINKVVSRKNRRHRLPGIVKACLVGEDGFEPPKSRDSRFTVCPIWPLWNSPDFLNARQIPGFALLEALFVEERAASEMTSLMRALSASRYEDCRLHMSFALNPHESKLSCGFMSKSNFNAVQSR